MSASDLNFDVKAQPNRTVVVGRCLFTPMIDEDYWAYRVRLSDTQSIVGFPKFMTIGIGFAVEDDDWNTNLPYTCTAEEIYDHIACNKGDEAISRESCLTAIRLIQDAVRWDRALDLDLRGTS